MSYYITCMMSGITEIGSVLLGLSKGYSLCWIIGVALAYQLGNILRFSVTSKVAKYESILSGVVLGLSIARAFMNRWELPQYIVTLAMFTLFSTILQNVRSSLQGSIPRWRKRTSRVVGFVLAAIIYILPNIGMIILSTLLLFYSLRTENFFYDNWFKNWENGAYGKRVCWAMVTHQAHYFAYNYILLVIVAKAVGNPILATVCFALNWIPYTITEPLIQKLKWNKWKQLAVFAHLFNAVVLVAMFFTASKSILWTVALWVLTGFGGGNVFCIKKALAKKVTFDKNVWSFSEQLGHILGVLSALIVSVCAVDPRISMIIAALYALITIPVILITLNR